jgi:hypothetical protein
MATWWRCIESARQLRLHVSQHFLDLPLDVVCEPQFYFKRTERPSVTFASERTLVLSIVVEARLVSEVTSSMVLSITKRCNP